MPLTGMDIIVSHQVCSDGDCVSEWLESRESQMTATLPLHTPGSGREAGPRVPWACPFLKMNKPLSQVQRQPSVSMT